MDIILFTIFMTINALALGAFELRLHTWAHILPATLCLLLFSFLLSIYKKKRFKIPKPSVSVPILVFLLLAFLSRFTAPYRFSAVLRFRSIASAAVFFFAVFNLTGGKSKRKLIAASLVAAGTAVALTGLLQYIGAIHGPWPTGGLGLRAPFVNHNHLAAFLEMIIPVGMAMVFSSLRPAWKLFMGYGTFIMLVTFVFTLSRGGWISLTFSVSVLLLLIFAKGNRKLVTIVTALLGVFILLALYQIGEEPVDKRINQLMEVSAEKEESGRLALFGAAIKMGLAHPLTGVGLGQFRQSFRAFRPPQVTGLPRFAHNDYLQVFAEMGIPGLVIILLIAYSIVRTGLKNSNSHLILGATCGVIAILVHSMVDFGLHLSANAMVLAFLSAVCLSGEYTKVSQRYITPVMGLTATILLFAFPSNYGLFQAGRLVNEGRKCLNQGLLSQGERDFIKAMKLTPQISEIHQNLGRARYLKGKLASRLGLSAKAVALYKSAIKSYGTALDLNPGAAENFFYQGLCQAEITRETKSPVSATAAVKFFKMAHKHDPRHGTYRRWLGMQLFVAGRKQDGVQVLKALVNESTTTDKSIFNILDFAYNHLTDRDIITELVPERNERIWLHLAKLYNKDKEWDKAVKLYKKAIAVSNDNPGIINTFAAAAQANDKLELAEELYLKLAGLKPNARVYNRLAGLARKTGDINKEEHWLKKAVEIEDKAFRPKLSMALFFSRNQREGKAVEILRQLIINYPDNYEAPYHLGLIMRRNKDYYRAIELFIEALKRKPDNIGIANVMAWTYVQTGLAIKGYRIWDKLIKRHPERHDLILNKASAHYGQREYKAALAALQQYAKLVPDGKFRNKPVATAIADLQVKIKKAARR